MSKSMRTCPLTQHEVALIQISWDYDRYIADATPGTDTSQLEARRLAVLTELRDSRKATLDAWLAGGTA